MRLHCLATGMAALSLVACATTRGPVAHVSVAYTSSPSGALVVRDGVVLGRTPFKLVVDAPLRAGASGEAAAPGCVTAKPVTFKWTSGATTTLSNPCRLASADAATIRKMPGWQDQYTASVLVSATRPEDAPGLQRDLRVADALGSQSPFVPPLAAAGSWMSASHDTERRYAPLLLPTP